MKTRLAGLALSALIAVGVSPLVLAGGSVKRGPVHDVVRMDQPFHLTGYQYRIHAMHWVASDRAFASAIAPYARAATPPNGDLMFTVPVRNVQSGEAGAPGLDVTAVYKDGTSATSDETPFAKDGSPLTSANVEPRQSKTMYYAITNVPKPTRSNPVVKLILRYAANNDRGFPNTYYLRHPILSRRDVVVMDQGFHLTGYDYRIHAMRWVNSGSAFATAIASYAKPATPPNGVLVFTVPVRNVQSGEAGAPGLDVTAVYKDGTSATSDETPFAKDGSPLTSANVEPGQSKTMYYAITNVPKPSRSNPVVKLILRYAANNDRGFPDAYYLFDPSLER